MDKTRTFFFGDGSCAKWRWDMFGNENVILWLDYDVSWLARVTTRAFLGSKWVRE